jgi:hypothetical protein
MKMHAFDLRQRILRAAAAPALLTPLLLICLGTSSAWAQEAEADASASGSLEGSTEASDDAPLEATTESSAEAEASTEDAAETEEPASTQAEAMADALQTPDEDAAGEKADAETPKPPPLALEILPGSAYPSEPLPGIRGGSLSFVMAGMQWPYMPSYGPEFPKLRIGFSGSSWVDANMRMVRPGTDSPDVLDLRMQGRLTFRVTPVYNFDKDWFAQSRIEFVAITEQQHEQGKYVDVDEAWVRVGRWKRFDATVGRTQGFEVYHFGMGLDINTQEREGARPAAGTTVQQAYALTELWDRGINNGALALHWYLPEWLRLELLARMGIAGAGNDLGVRPAAILDFGILKVKGGYENRVQWTATPSTDQRKTEAQGFAGSVNLVFDPWVELGGGVAHRMIDGFSEEGEADPFTSSDTTTWGGFVNVRPYFKNWTVGLGYHNTDWKNFNVEAGPPPNGAGDGRPENQNHVQMFGAVQYQLWDVFFIKYVLAYSQVHIEKRQDNFPDLGYTDQQISHRLRFMLLF